MSCQLAGLNSFNCIRREQRVNFDGKRNFLTKFQRKLAKLQLNSLPTNYQLSSVKENDVISDEQQQQQQVYIETYGCQMNINDSEILMGVLSQKGYGQTEELDSADVILLNTCAIREGAESKIWGRLQQLREIKKQKKDNPPVVGVLGCMAERLKDKLLDKEKLLDLVAGPDAYKSVPDLIEQVKHSENRWGDDRETAMNVQLSLEETYADIVPVRPAGRYSAFISIMRGCDNMCAFCIVPYTRGHERSRPVQSILDEVKQLSAQGYKEVILLGQNVNSYADFSEFQEQQFQIDGSQEILNDLNYISSEDQKNTSNGVGQDQESIQMSQNIDQIQKSSIKSQDAGQNQQSIHTSQNDENKQSSHSNFLSNNNNLNKNLSQNEQINTVEQKNLQQENIEDPYSVYAPGFSSIYKPKRTGAVQFAELLRRVAEVDPEMRVRFTSPHPKDFSQDVLEAIQKYPNICNQLHMPAQSGSTTNLDRMKRGYTRQAYNELIQRVRRTIPNVALSTDIIVGFCGETEQEHRETVDLMEKVGFDQAFMFAYSEREKTYAARMMEDDVLLEDKKRRLQEVIDMFKKKQEELQAKEVGSFHLVLVEGAAKRPEGHLAGRTDSFKKVVFRGGDWGVGDYVAVKITGFSHGTLLGEPIEKIGLIDFVSKYGNGVQCSSQSAELVC